MTEAQSARERLKISGTGAIKIETAQDAIDFATWCYESGYLPQHVKNPKQAFTIMQRGAEMGLPPFSSWRYIYQTKGGKLAIESKGALACVQSKATFGYYKERIEGEGDGRKGVATACRKGSDYPTVKEFTMEDARLAGLLRRPKTREGKEYDGPWQAYIKDMLLSKARSRALEIEFAAELGGIPIEGLAEEIEARELQRGLKVTPIRERLGASEQRALPEGQPPASFTDLIAGKDYVPAPQDVPEPTGGVEGERGGELPSPLEAHVEERMDKTTVAFVNKEGEVVGGITGLQEPTQAEQEALPPPAERTCQEKIGENALCSLVVVPGTDRCSKHHFTEPAAEPAPESPFAQAIRDRQRKRFRDPEEGQRPDRRGMGPLFDTDEE
jgi:hypothetical protein